ncbi:hypothetical protein Droror1_Dr00019958 [Drosera rotundifolia]
MKRKWQNLDVLMAAAMAAMFVLLTNVPLSSSFADSVPEVAIGRKLMQTPKNCPVNFEFANYTILTSKCKGPLYPPDICCAAFKAFACPYVDDIDDLNTDCATTMFSYINLNGNYPPGLFSSECREGKLGLACPAVSLALSDKANASSMSRDNRLQVVFTGSVWAIVLLLL